MRDSKSRAQLQVMWNRLLSIVEEQGQILLRAAFSPIVRECGDISAGIFDCEGRMLAQAVTGTPRAHKYDGSSRKRASSALSRARNASRRHLHDKRPVARLRSFE